MHHEKWYQIWSQRKLDINKDSDLACLLAADGMDTQFGTMPKQAWLDYCRKVADILGINHSSQSLLEVGCGAGAFLYPFYQQGHKVQGIDQSESLIKLANEYLPNGQFDTAFSDSFKAKAADFVMSMGVFMYFPNLAYAENVIKQISKHATKAIAILDIPDLAKKDMALELRQGMMLPEEYQEKYTGLDHLYYSKPWFKQQLQALGYNRITVMDQSIEGYNNSLYRFNIFAWK